MRHLGCHGHVKSMLICSLSKKQHLKDGKGVILGVVVWRSCFFFNNWQQRDSSGVKITAICQSRGHKPKSNGVVPTSATPD